MNSLFILSPLLTYCKFFDTHLTVSILHPTRIFKGQFAEDIYGLGIKGSLYPLWHPSAPGMPCMASSRLLHSITSNLQYPWTRRYLL